MSNPLISIDGVNREMTDEETADYEAFCANAFRVPDPE
jgi:hypothetical protein